MNTRERPPLYVGDPNATPFVRFDTGEIYPPNTIYADAETLLSEYDGTTAATEILKKHIAQGPISGQYGVLAESTWFAMLNNYFRHHGAKDTGITDPERLCIEALRLMLTRPHQAAWSELRTFLVANADDLSGWNVSFRKTLSEERNVFRGEDGNYYCYDGEEGLCQIFGTGTTEENRLDFITVQLLHGFLHNFLAMFTLFATADDFASNPSQYHRWVKASLPDPRFHLASANWMFLHFDYSRSYSWQPHSLLCDPRWLAGDILGGLTDTLEIDHWKKHRDRTQADQDWLNDGCKFQVDYVLETTVQIGHERNVYIPFEDKIIRWVNGTPEQHATVSISVANLHDHSAEDEKLNRFLTLLVWEHGQPILKTWGSGGGRSPYPKVVSPRRAAGLLVDAGYPLRLLNTPLSDTQWLALALWREAQNSSSKFYEYLCYWKILDRAFPKQPDKQKWLESIAVPKLSHENHMKEILAKTTDLEHYLRVIRLNAIKHIRKAPVLNPDNPADVLSITKETFIMERIAALVMQEELKL